MNVDKNKFCYGMFDFGDASPLAESVMSYLVADVSNIKEHYLKLGRHLYEFQNNEYYRDFGFDNFEECIARNLGLDKGTASRCMNVWLRFCNKNVVIEEYEEFNYSQLVEMLPMSDEQIAEISPGMSVREIREFKKESKKKAKSSLSVATSQPIEELEPEEIAQFKLSEYYKLHGLALRNYCMKFAKQSPIEEINIISSTGKREGYMSVRKVNCNGLGTLYIVDAEEKK